MCSSDLTRFLGHAERTSVILHLIDGTESAIVKAYRTIRRELDSYGHGLAEKPEIVAINKIDAIDKASLARKRAALEKAAGTKVFAISGVSGEGLKEVLTALARAVAKSRVRPKPQKQSAGSWAP